MPRSKVINRRNISQLSQRKISVSDEAMTTLAEIASRLHVSQGSIADMAIKELRAQEPVDIAKLLLRWGHLTKDEYAMVLQVIGEAEPDAPEEGREER